MLGLMACRAEFGESKPLMSHATWRKNIVAAGLARCCCIQLSYVISVARPLSIYCDTYVTGAVLAEVMEAAVDKCQDLTPRGIGPHLGLNNPIYERTASYEQFGRAADGDGGFS